jgi:hypothetical protein
MDIRTPDEGLIEAYLFERHVQKGDINGIKSAFAQAPGVRFVGQFVGAFNLFARVVANDLGELQSRIANEYQQAGVRSDFSINVTANRPAAPKRGSPRYCALVCCKTTADPFGLLEPLDNQFLEQGAYGAAVVTSPDFDVLVDLGADSLEGVLERVLELRQIPGIGRTATALADLADNEIRPESS